MEDQDQVTDQGGAGTEQPAEQAQAAQPAEEKAPANLAASEAEVADNTKLPVVGGGPGSTLAITQAEDDEMFGESSIDITTGLSFSRIKIVRETAQFDFGNEEYAKSMEGFILFKHRASQWWEIPFDQRSEGDDPRPQCYSINGVVPIGGDKIQSDLCSSCTMNQFGSAEGDDKKGKACRNTLRMLFLQDGAVLPVIITAPPTSLGKNESVQQWLNTVPNEVAKAYNAIGKKTKSGKPIVDYFWAHVELSLDKRTFSGGDAAVLCIKTLDVITPKTDLGALRQLFAMKKDATALYETELTAYMEAEAGGDNDLEDTANVEQYDDDTPI